MHRPETKTFEYRFAKGYRTLTQLARFDYRFRSCAASPRSVLLLHDAEESTAPSQCNKSRILNPHFGTGLSKDVSS